MRGLVESPPFLEFDYPSQDFREITPVKAILGRLFSEQGLHPQESPTDTPLYLTVGSHIFRDNEGNPISFSLRKLTALTGSSKYMGTEPIKPVAP